METKENGYGFKVLRFKVLFLQVFKKAFHLEYNLFHNT